MADDAILKAINELRDDLRSEMRSTSHEPRGEITSLRVAVMDRFDRMEERFSQMSDDIVVGMGRADWAHKAADNTRDELRALSQEVAALSRKQLRLKAQFHDFSRPA